jgi:hypothetical protein
MGTRSPVRSRLITAGRGTTAFSMKQRRNVSVIIMMLLAVTSQMMRSQDVKINSNMVIEADGTLRLDNAATVWNDLMVFPDAMTKGGSYPPEWGPPFMKNPGGTSQGVCLWMFAPNQEEDFTSPSRYLITTSWGLTFTPRSLDNGRRNTLRAATLYGAWNTQLSP